MQFWITKGLRDNAKQCFNKVAIILKRFSVYQHQNQSEEEEKARSMINRDRSVRFLTNFILSMKNKKDGKKQRSKMRRARNGRRPVCLLTYAYFTWNVLPIQLVNILRAGGESQLYRKRKKRTNKERRKKYARERRSQEREEKPNLASCRMQECASIVRYILICINRHESLIIADTFEFANSWKSWFTIFRMTIIFSKSIMLDIINKIVESSSFINLR